MTGQAHLIDADTLFQQGVVAIRNQDNPALGRELLILALQHDPDNDMAWLWLTRTVNDWHTRMQYVERALQINPANRQARRMRARLLAVPPRERHAPPRPIPQPKTIDQPLTEEETARSARIGL